MWSLRSRQLLLASLLLCVTAIWCVYRLSQPPTQTTSAIPLDDDLSPAELTEVIRVLRQQGFTGVNARPAFTNMIQVADLPAKYVPGNGVGSSSGRLVIVGDVHGQKAHLLHLLEQAKFQEGEDHLVLVGDMIAKGPDSAGVVDLAMKMGASAVRGNHEDRIITTDDGMKALQDGESSAGSVEEQGLRQMQITDDSFAHGDSKDRKLVEQLGDKRLKWLRSLPIILRVGTLGNMGEVVVVHAGLAPDVKLDRQDPTMVMNMRSMDKHGVPSGDRDGLQWTKVWNKFQQSLPANERTTVIYGHDKKRGLQIHKHSFGLDTGCIKGGKLTALVIEGGPEHYKHRIVQVG